MQDLIGRTLGQYRVVEHLGGGGMGVVYRAEDTKLGREVALKFLPPEWSRDPAARERFLREARAASALEDTRICTVHDIDETDDGRLFIAMAFYEGETLKKKVQRGRLPIDTAIDIAIQAAEGLERAHTADIIHRDIKPANLMLTQRNEVVIVDFGLAKLAGELSLTKSGSSLGTPHYMSPEQARGDRVDGRTDLWALGVVLFEMLTGRRPFKGENNVSIARAILDDEPSSLAEARPEVPSELGAIVSKALEKDADRRYQNASQFLSDLKRLQDQPSARRGVTEVIPSQKPSRHRLYLVPLVAAIVVVVCLWLIFTDRAPVPPAAIEPMLVLVADFDNKTGDDVFSLVLEEATGIGLEGAPFISVCERGDARKIAEVIQPGDADLDEDMSRLLAKREGINVVVSGSIGFNNGRYPIWMKALDGATGETIALRGFESETREGVLAAIGKLAGHIREALGETAPSGDRLAVETFTAASLEAMSAYARGQDLAAQGQFEGALEAYMEAVANDPEFGRAYAGMGVVYGNLRREKEAEESYQKAFQHLDRMSERERYRTLGGYYLLVSHNYEKAIENYQSLVDQYPADGGACSNLGYAYHMVRDFDRAVEAGSRSVELDPGNLIKRINYAMYAMYAGDFETAIAESKTVFQQNPAFGYALFTLGRAAAAAGDPKVARDAFARLSGSGGMGSSLAPMGQADLEMYLGHYEAAAAILGPAIEVSNDLFQKANMLVGMGEVGLARGQLDQAAENAERAIELSQHESIQYLAARLLLAAGRGEAADEIALELENRLQSQTMALSALIRGERALEKGQLGTAMRELRLAREEHSIWFGHYLMGRAFFEAGHFPEALDEYDQCVRGKGEITDIFLVDSATLRYFPSALYWLARSREAVGNVDAARKLYGEYLELRGGAEPPDVFATDAEERLGF